MRISVRAFVLTLCISFLISFFAPFSASAQTYPGTTATQPTTNSGFSTELDPAIPPSQHMRVQTLVIDILSAVACQLGGIDPVDPRKPCVDIDPLTRKLGYHTSQFGENGQ